MADNPFTSARSGFINIKDDLDGCLVLVLAHEVEMMPSKNRNQDDYEMYKCTVVVLDGSPSEAVEGDDMPITLDDMGVSGSFIGPQIKSSMKTGRPTLGRVEVFKNAQGTESARLAEPTEEDMELAQIPGRELMNANNPFAEAAPRPEEKPAARKATAAKK